MVKKLKPKDKTAIMKGIKEIAKCVLNKNFEREQMTYVLYVQEVLFENRIREEYSLLCSMGKDSVFLPDITSEYDFAFEIFFKFARNCVSPMSSYDVIEEILSDFV